MKVITRRSEEWHEPVWTVVSIESDEKAVVLFRGLVVAYQERVQVRVKMLVDTFQVIYNLEIKTMRFTAKVLESFLYLSVCNGTDY